MLVSGLHELYWSCSQTFQILLKKKKSNCSWVRFKLETIEETFHPTFKISSIYYGIQQSHLQ